MDYKEIEKGLLEILKTDSGKELTKLKDCAAQLVSDNKERIERLKTRLANGEIAAEDLQSLLEDQKVTLENRLLSIRIMGKAAAEKTTNKIIAFFRESIITVVKGAL